jgi:metallo-beta-lactamase class B
MLIKLTLLFLFFYITTGFTRQSGNNSVIISEDIKLLRISENVYIHVSYCEIAPYGRVASNGLILTNENTAFLFDTPMTEDLTKDLVTWIRDSMKMKIVGFVPTHWHNDCMGGLGYLKRLGIPSFANEMTIIIAKSKNLPVPEQGFKDSLVLKLNEKKVFCEYFGAAHSLDNIVVWIPSEKILFAGCMVKDLKSNNLGNTADGDLKRYPETIQKLLDKYSDARIVIPGHGDFGDISMIRHTLELSK